MLVASLLRSSRLRTRKETRLRAWSRRMGRRRRPRARGSARLRTSMIDLAAALAEIVNRPAEGRGAAGIAALVAEATEPVAVWTPPSRDEPAYLAYSITKTFTAVLFLLLRDERRLALDDPLCRWFPGIPGANRISRRQLLNHTRGHPRLRRAVLVPRRRARLPLDTVVLRTDCGGDVRQGTELRAGDRLGVLEPRVHAVEARGRGGRRCALRDADRPADHRPAGFAANVRARLARSAVVAGASLVA